MRGFAMPRKKKPEVKKRNHLVAIVMKKAVRKHKDKRKRAEIEFHERVNDD